MPFVPVDTAGNWVKMQDLAAEGDAVFLKKGFLVSDDDNVYQGESTPRWIVKSITADDEEIQTSVPKGYSRDINLSGAARFLDGEADGYLLELRFVKTKGAYIDAQITDPNAA